MFVALTVPALGQSFNALGPSIRAIVPTGHGTPGVMSVPPLALVQIVPFVGVTAICRMYGLPYGTFWLLVLNTGAAFELNVTKLSFVVLAWFVPLTVTGMSVELLTPSEASPA